MTNYEEYRLNSWQRIGAIFVGCAVCFGAIWLMYRHALPALIGAPLGAIYPRFYAESLKRKRSERLRLQFKEALQALSSSLAAGRSLENAFASLEGDLMILLGETRSDLMMEIRGIVNRMKNGESLDVPLQDFAGRSGLEEVKNFADAVSICKRQGGDMIEVVRKTSQWIGEKLEVEQEVTVLIARKKLEARLMMGMPFAFVGVLGFMAQDYMEPLRHGVGIVLLTFCLLLLLGCCYWMFRIMEIRL
jgi:tight adherence protein B